MFDFLIELAFNFLHEGKRTPFDNAEPVAWHHKI
jgi:hypothetical protein